MERILVAARRNGEVVTINGDYLEDIPPQTVEELEAREWKGLVLENDPTRECILLYMERSPWREVPVTEDPTGEGVERAFFGREALRD